jgi:hypothetical protein
MSDYLHFRTLFEIWRGRLLMAVTPYADQMRSSATRGPTVTSRTVINA